MDTTPSSDARSVRFSTAGIPEPDRVASWEAHNTALVAPMRFRPLQSVFHASSVRTTIGALDIVRTAATSHVVERDAGHVRDHPADQVAVHMILRGESAFCTSDGVLTLRPGQVLLHSDQPFLRGYAGDQHDLSITVPRSLYAEFTHGAPPPRPHVVDVDGPLAACVIALGRLLDGAARSETSVSPDDATVLELLAALVSGRRAPLSAGAHYAAAREVAERHLHDPGLSATSIAARIGISERQLSRVFAAQNTTVPQFVRGLRLDRAHRMLATSGGRERLTVTEVAHRCGFASASHFSTSFAKRFGIRPTDLARQARGMAAVTSDGARRAE
ncbi:helix-turn-helix domain-containing protein [Streptomyces sp. NPDC056486]|uniref:helix-turn-helix domain-containing protein n=1 Tax=Streptomyces sp. NPDC056486 TaxID=3345835 RepID=UPI0036A842A0